jgi:hypothetical protein
MNCTASCKTKDHATYEECLKSNMPMIAPSSQPSRTGWDMKKIKSDNKELDSYYSAVKQGIEPISTKQKDIDAAVKLSNEAGKAFDGNSLNFKE